MTGSGTYCVRRARLSLPAAQVWGAGRVSIRLVWGRRAPNEARSLEMEDSAVLLILPYRLHACALHAASLHKSSP